MEDDAMLRARVYHQCSLLDALVFRNSLVEIVLVTSVGNQSSSFVCRGNRARRTLLEGDNLSEMNMAMAVSRQSLSD